MTLFCWASPSHSDGEPTALRSTSSTIESGSTEDRTIGGFCMRHDMSKSGYYRLPKEVRERLETVYGPRTIRITKKAEAEFDRRHAKPNTTEQRFLDRMRARRTAQARRAAAASLAGENHVSKRHRAP
jgi:hypothetical protein